MTTSSGWLCPCLAQERKPLEAPRPIEDEEEVEGEQIREEDLGWKELQPARVTHQSEGLDGSIVGFLQGFVGSRVVALYLVFSDLCRWCSARASQAFQLGCWKQLCSGKEILCTF